MPNSNRLSLRRRDRIGIFLVLCRQNRCKLLDGDTRTAIDPRATTTSLSSGYPAGARLGWQCALDGLTRSSPHLSNRCEDMDPFGRNGGSWDPVGGGFNWRSSSLYHR